MMSLEQAIEHAERAYKESRNGLQYALKRGETKFAERCKKDAEEFGQYVSWLRELQERRKADSCEGCVNESGKSNLLVCYTCRRHYHYADLYKERRTDET